LDQTYILESKNYYKQNGDNRTIVAVAESLYNTIDKEKFPRLYASVATCLASNIGVMHKTDKSYDLHQMVAIYEKVIKLTDNKFDSESESELFNAHVNLFMFYFNNQDWNAPEQCDEKALEHGTSALKLMERNPGLEQRHADQNITKLSILDGIISVCTRQAYRYESDPGVSIKSLQKAAKFNEKLLGVLKVRKTSRGLFTNMWKRSESDEQNKTLTGALKAKEMIEQAIEEQRKKMP
jgi:hypothetical protein